MHESVFEIGSLVFKMIEKMREATYELKNVKIIAPTVHAC